MLFSDTRPAEDDPMIGESLVDGLRGDSYAVDLVRAAPTCRC